MAPVFQRLIALAVGVLLGLLFLCEMSFAVRDYLSHMLEIFFLILIRVLVGIFIQDLVNVAVSIAEWKRFKTSLWCSKA